MKKNTALVTLVFMTLFFNFLSFSQLIENGPKIEFKNEEHDYGNIKYAADGTCSFEFTNSGNAPLLISDAKGSCGCTVPTYSKEPIAPGAKGSITVTYDTKRPGPITKSVTIMSNALNEPTKVIRIKGMVGPQPEVESPVNNVGPKN
jgi:hypothetical protein